MPRTGKHGLRKGGVTYFFIHAPAQVFCISINHFQCDRPIFISFSFFFLPCFPYAHLLTCVKTTAVFRHRSMKMQQWDKRRVCPKSFCLLILDFPASRFGRQTAKGRIDIESRLITHACHPPNRSSPTLSGPLAKAICLLVHPEYSWLFWIVQPLKMKPSNCFGTPW